jgi:hypothetical protein
MKNTVKKNDEFYGGKLKKIDIITTPTFKDASTSYSKSVKSLVLCYYLNSWCRVLPKKLIVTYRAIKDPVFDAKDVYCRVHTLKQEPV